MAFSGSDRSLDDLISGVERGLLINSLWYIRFVDANNLLLTGLTRDGVFKIEDGAISVPVKNMRFNESPLISLANVTATGVPLWRQTWLGSVLMPPMVMTDMTFTAKTDAI